MTKSFERQFNSEILFSEKLRATLLAVLFLTVLFIFSMIMLLVRETILEYLESFTPVYLTMGVFGFFALRELSIRKLIDKLIRENRKVPEFVRYVTLFLETSIPTIVIVIFAFYLQSIFVLTTPVVYLYFIIIALSTLSLDYKLTLFSGFVGGVEYLLIAVYMILNQEAGGDMTLTTQQFMSIAKGFLIIAAGGASGFVAYQLRKRIFSSFKLINERNQVINLFGQQVSKEIVDELITGKTGIKSESKFVCVMFLDIEGFTPFAEKRKPEEIIDFQNKIFSFMIEIITENNGIINQILGDGIMATFGAPLSKGNDCENAVNAAIKILDALREKNERQEIPLTNIRIGLHAGNVVAGNVGTEIRKQYSISGNTVIIASRIEQLNKEFNSRLLISKEVLDKIELDSKICDSIGEVKIKGRAEPVHIFKIA